MIRAVIDTNVPVSGMLSSSGNEALIILGLNLPPEGPRAAQENMTQAGYGDGEAGCPGEGRRRKS